jgi:hypothetical protein
MNKPGALSKPDNIVNAAAPRAGMQEANRVYLNLSASSRQFPEGITEENEKEKGYPNTRCSSFDDAE